jgi:lysozyme
VIDAGDSILLAALERDEGFKPYAYLDSEGFWTIGIGTLIDKRGGGITHDEALYLLRNRLASKIADLDRELPWWRKLSPTRQRVLANLAYNLGVGTRTPPRGLLAFRNTLAAVEQGRWDDAAKGMLDSLYARQVGDRAKRLAEQLRAG